MKHKPQLLGRTFGTQLIAAPRPRGFDSYQIKDSAIVYDVKRSKTRPQKTSEVRVIGRRKIDERDVDKLLSSLSDRQIASLFGMTDDEVYSLRQSRRQNKDPRDEKNSTTPPSED